MSARILAFTIAVVTLAATAAPVLADDNQSSVEVEFQRQHDRIEDGIRTRQLTRHEVTMLRDEQDTIARMIARARSDGRIDPFERREIAKAQAVASNHIYAEKHDVEVAAAPVVRREGFWRRHHWWN